jgi:hypothetical protein
MRVVEDTTVRVVKLTDKQPTNLSKATSTVGGHSYREDAVHRAEKRAMPLTGGGVTRLIKRKG